MIYKPYKKKDKTEKDCPKCSSKLYNEIIKEIDYPYICLNCDENFYNFEIKESKKWMINLKEIKLYKR